MEEKSKVKHKAKLVMAILLAFVILLVGIYNVVRWYGKNSLTQGTDNPWAWAMNPAGEGVCAELDGTTYYYRSDIINILCVGVDKEGEMNGPDYSGASRGQADAIFLLSLDTTQKEIRVIVVPRDSMVTLSVYDILGNYAGTMEGQIALQYAYGDGLLQSGELMRSRVSDILGGIPIHGYAAMDLECIGILNDAIGGVELTMDEDYTMLDEAFEKGATVRLMGEQAMHFVRNRDTEIPGSAYTRLTRQKQYLEAFEEQAKNAIREDATLPLTVLEQMKDYLVTDMSVSQMTYLASEVLDYEFSQENVYVLEGEIQMKGEHEAYYLNYDSVFQLKLKLFCKTEE